MFGTWVVGSRYSVQQTDRVRRENCHPESTLFSPSSKRASILHGGMEKTAHLSHARCFKDLGCHIYVSRANRRTMSLNPSVAVSMPGISHGFPYRVPVYLIFGLFSPSVSHVRVSSSSSRLAIPRIINQFSMLWHLRRQRSLATYESEYVCTYIHRHVL